MKAILHQRKIEPTAIIQTTTGTTVTRTKTTATPKTLYYQHKTGNNNNGNNKQHESDLENSDITVEGKEIAGTTMSHTKSNVRSAGVLGQGKNPTEKSIELLGDSKIKNINGWDLAKKIKGNCKVKVHVKPFSGAKAD